mgnify:CR=1 FL=1
MPLPDNLDSTDLIILRAIAEQPEITTGEIESKVYLSRTQVLRRLKELERRGLITRADGIPGRAYHYTLSPQVTPEEIEQFDQARLSTNRDPVAREALSIILQGIQIICDTLGDMAGRIENILR